MFGPFVFDGRQNEPVNGRSAPPRPPWSGRTRRPARLLHPAARSLPLPLPPPRPPGCASDCQIKRRAGPAGQRARSGPDMAALYACTKCHQRFPFEALSQGQQLCKVRGLGRRPGTGTLEVRPGAPCFAVMPGGAPWVGRGRLSSLRNRTRPAGGWRGMLGSPGPRPGPGCRLVRVLSNRVGLFSDPVKSGEGTTGPLLAPASRARGPWAGFPVAGVYVVAN